MQLGALHTPPPAIVPHLAERARLDLMPIPTEADWFKGAPADGDDLGNGTYGCCVPAADYQEVRLRLWNAMGERVWKPTRSMVLQRYARLTGFVLATGANDNGTDTAADTADFATHGIRINEQLLDIPHWVLLSPGNLAHWKIAVAHLGSVALTLNLPAAVQDQNFAKTPGSGPDWEPGSWGMHRVLSGRFQGDDFWIRTWGIDLPVHPEFWARYCVGAEARISPTWLQATGLAPSGLDMDGLMADRARLVA